MRRRLAYEIQVRFYGGLKPETTKRLRQLQQAFAANPDYTPLPNYGLKTRKRADTEWKDTLYQVGVLDDGSEYKGSGMPPVRDRQPDHRQQMVRAGVLQDPRVPAMTQQTRRCAIYTRKSTEEGLIRLSTPQTPSGSAARPTSMSQAHEGWKLIKTAYDDGGFSGGSMERPAVQRLMSDLKQRHIDIVVVYKVDRLTRSLADFAKIVEILDGHGASFVSVTQQFNTTSSMGRLTLNVLLVLRPVRARGHG